MSSPERHTLDSSPDSHSTRAPSVEHTSEDAVIGSKDHDVEQQQQQQQQQQKQGGSHRQESTRKTSDKTIVSPPKINDDKNPLLFPQWRKNTILGIICSCCLCVTCASSVISTDYTFIETELGASSEVAILSLSLFVLGLAIGPLLVGPFSERFGRWPVYVISYGCFFLLGFPVAFANNLAVLFIFRFLTGFAGSGFLSVAGGSISDMWQANGTFMPLAYFSISAFLGPVVGPVIGSFVAQFSSQWRWSLWTITIWSFVNLVCISAFTPETFAPVILRKQIGPHHLSEKEAKEKPSIISSIISDAEKIPLLLFYEPMLALLCLWSGILLGIIYLFFEFFPIVFGDKGLSTYQVGLCFLGIMVTNFIALASMPLWKRHLETHADPTTGIPPPEARLATAKLGCFLSPIGLFIFAFTSYPHVPWIGAVIGSGLFGMGCYYLFFSIFMYTTINWRPVAASAMGANSAVRCVMASIFPLFADYMIYRLSSPGAAALLAGLNCLMIPVPFILTRYGAQIRARSRYTS